MRADFSCDSPEHEKSTGMWLYLDLEVEGEVEERGGRVRVKGEGKARRGVDEAGGAVRSGKEGWKVCRESWWSGGRGKVGGGDGTDCGVNGGV